MADKYYNHENDYYNPTEESGENANWKALQKAFSDLPTGGGGDSPVILVTCDYDSSDPGLSTTGAALDNLTISDTDFTAAMTGSKALIIAVAGKANSTTVSMITFLPTTAETGGQKLIVADVYSANGLMELMIVNAGSGWSGTIKAVTNL